MHTARGRSTYMLATMLEAQPHKDNVEIARLLDGFEYRLSVDERAISMRSTQWRLLALGANRSVCAGGGRNRPADGAGTPPAPSSDYIKTLGLELWKQAKARKESGDQQARSPTPGSPRCSTCSSSSRSQDGKMNAKSLTGTLSILAQAYVMMNDSARARTIFEQVVKAAPSSPDANAGLARLAQAGKDYREASDLWTRVESEAAESDDLMV